MWICFQSCQNSNDYVIHGSGDKQTAIRSKDEETIYLTTMNI